MAVSSNRYYLPVVVSPACLAVTEGTIHTCCSSCSATEFEIAVDTWTLSPTGFNRPISLLILAFSASAQNLGVLDISFFAEQTTKYRHHRPSLLLSLPDHKRNRAMTTTFQEPGSASRECSACMDDHTSDFIMEVEGDPVCHDCIRQIFHFAIADDSNFPPVWSGTPLQLADFERILDASMISDFRDKAEKYSMLQRQGVSDDQATQTVERGC